MYSSSPSIVKLLQANLLFTNNLHASPEFMMNSFLGTIACRQDVFPKKFTRCPIWTVHSMSPKSSRPIRQLELGDPVHQPDRILNLHVSYNPTSSRDSHPTKSQTFQICFIRCQVSRSPSPNDGTTLPSPAHPRHSSSAISCDQLYIVSLVNNFFFFLFFRSKHHGYSLGLFSLSKIYKV